MTQNAWKQQILAFVRMGPENFGFIFFFKLLKMINRLLLFSVNQLIVSQKSTKFRKVLFEMPL